MPWVNGILITLGILSVPYIVFPENKLIEKVKSTVLGSEILALFKFIGTAIFFIFGLVLYLIGSVLFIAIALIAILIFVKIIKWAWYF